MQLNIFECEKSIQSTDYVYKQIIALQVNQKIYIHDLQIERTERFYVVSKGNEFEEPFQSASACYEFINGNL